MSRVTKFITLGLLISGILANGTNGPRQNDFGIRSQASNNGSGSSSAESVAEQKRFQDLPPTVFAPSGRLHMVEKVCAETTDPLDTTSPLVVAILCNGGKSVAVVSTTPISPHCSFDYQFMSDSNTTMHNTTLGNYSAPLLLELMDDATPDPLNPPLLSMIGPSFLIGTGGNAAEAIALHIKIQQVVLSLIQQEACTVHTIPTSLVARHVADMVQIPTQSVVDEDHPKMLASSAVLVGMEMGYDDEEPELPCIWRIDPTGQFFKCDMVAVGRAAHIAESYLIRFCLHRMLGISEEDDDKEPEDESEISMQEVVDQEYLINSDIQKVCNSLSTTQALKLAYRCISKTLSKQTSVQTSFTGESVKPRSFGILKGVLLDTSIKSSAKGPVLQSLQRRRLLPTFISELDLIKLAHES